MSPSVKCRRDLMSLIFCKCGCGEQREEFDSQKRKRQYIKGHFTKGKLYPETSERMKSKNNPMFGKKENHPNYRGGKPRCKICGIEISYKKEYCKKCVKQIKPVWNKNTTGLCKPNSGSFQKGLIPLNKIGDGIIKLHKLIRGMPEYKEWRLQVFGRDNFTCQECGIRGVYLEPHHIKAFSNIIKEYNMTTINDARINTELWNINNGITLCKECHSKTDNYKGLNKNKEM